MKRFKYKAKDRDGKLVSGEVEANDQVQAARLVKDRDLIVINVSLVGNVSSILSFFKNRVSYEQITNFTRQLSTMIAAGLPITEALLILRSQSTGMLQKVVAQILADVEGGESLTDSIKKHPKFFSPTYIALIKSGEMGGVLDKVLLRLADNMEKQQEFKSKVKGALIYPIVIVVGMVGVGIIMMIFVIPRLLSLYTEFEAELPVPTKILMGISDLLLKFWPVVILILVGAFYGFSAYRKTSNGKLKIDEFVFKIPVFGDLQRQVILTDLTRTLALMVSAGVSILEGLNISAEVVSNSVVANALKDVSKKVEKGFPVAFAFGKHPEAFPFILSQMIAVGEETGKMDEVMQKVSHVFEVESEQKVKAMTSLIEPMIMVVLGIGVAFLVIAVILPIYNLTSQF